MRLAYANGCWENEEEREIPEEALVVRMDAAERALAEARGIIMRRFREWPTCRCHERMEVRGLMLDAIILTCPCGKYIFIRGVKFSDAATEALNHNGGRIEA